MAPKIAQLRQVRGTSAQSVAAELTPCYHDPYLIQDVCVPSDLPSVHFPISPAVDSLQTHHCSSLLPLSPPPPVSSTSSPLFLSSPLRPHFSFSQFLYRGITRHHRRVRNHWHPSTATILPTTSERLEKPYLPPYLRLKRLYSVLEQVSLVPLIFSRAAPLSVIEECSILEHVRHVLSHSLTPAPSLSHATTLTMPNQTHNP